MSYDHTLFAEISFKPNTTIQAVITALEPLINHFEWHIENLISNDLPYENSINMTADDGHISGMEIDLRGDTLSGYEEALQAFAINLTHIADTSHMVLKNYDSCELEDAITRIWYGPECEITIEKKRFAASEAIYMLEEVDVATSVIDAIKALLASDAVAA